MGAGLLAKAVCQPISMLNDEQPSRASPLPQGIVVTRVIRGLPDTPSPSVRSQPSLLAASVAPPAS
ncbi:hypothetical protein C1X65_01300 [Pseudomonas sp. FW305-70]|nr:hypothetical protein C1X65_01300 [Pseudomonas sp. FW305-70]